MSADALSADGELNVQTAFLLCRAVESPDPVESLQASVHLHNVAEYSLHAPAGSALRVLVALSSEAVPLAAGCKSQAKVESTVFVAFGNYLASPSSGGSSGGDAAAAADSCSSLASFLGALRPAKLPGVDEGARA